MITASTRTANKWRRLGCRAVVKDYSVLAGAQEVWLAVKPFQIGELAGELSPHLPGSARVVSLLAGWTPSSLRSLLKHSGGLVTVMTNTAARLDAGLYAVFHEGSKMPGGFSGLRPILAKLGTFAGGFPEAQMPSVTALVGSAPAFLLQLQQQYESYAAEHGISAKVARQWFAALGAGTAALVGAEPQLGVLMAQIATPGGCTQRGLDVLAAAPTLKHALVACADRAKEMGA